jgi:YD repeat-containing protein
VVDATPGGVAEVDTDGDGMSDDDATLALLGITSAEQETLADLYGPESSLWRIQISHFSPIDGNFPECRSASGICTSVEGPEQIPAADSTEDDPCEDGGSIIECQNQVLGERLGITGTPFALNYRSNRVPGRTINRTLEIPLTGETVPDGISGVILQVSVAGRMFSDTFPPDPNQTTTFTWDGRDAYGRTVQGGQLATVRIGYDYQLFYAVPPDVARSFGLTCDGSSTVRPGFEACIIPAELNTRARQENARFVEWQGRVGSFQSPNLGLGGWSIDVHHAYDPLVGVLHRGDGGRRSASGMGRVITTVAGTGLGGFFNSDGRPATEAMLYSPAGTAVGPDGTLYIADNLNHRIRRVGPDGIITTIAGNGLAGFRGDGPATMRRISYPQDVALGPDGILYIADRGNSLIRTVNASGYMRTIVGTPSYFGGFSGDDGPADEAKVSRPHGVLVTDDGVVYIADTGNNRIRRIGPDGIITTVAGNGFSGFGGDGGPATAARLRAPQDVAVGRDGSLYISDTGNHRIRRVGPEGIITTVAGTGVFGSGGDGGPAVAAQLGTPGGVAIGPDGALYIGDSGNRRVRWVGTDGVMRTLAGTGQNGDSGDGGLVGAAELGDPWRVGVGPDGRIFISDRSRHRLRAVAAALPGLSVGNNVIAAEDGSEVYVFDVAGRHQHTLDALTGTTRFEFGYDAAGLLTTVTDGDGNVTTIERDVDGKPLAIVAPFGQRTSLTLDGDGFLVSLTNAADESVGLTYHAGGLLATLTDPRGGVHRFTYDADGRLIRDEDPVGGFVTLERTELPNGFEVKKTTALGRTTTHRVESSALGRQFVVTSPSGFSSSTTRAADGSETMALSDGTSWTMQMAPDPDVGMQVPILNQTTLRMPSGLTSSISASRQLVLSDADPTIIVGRVDNIATNGRVYTIERDDVLRAFTTTTPEGRVGTRRTDLFGRTIETRTDGIRAFEYAYDSRGRVSQVTWGNRIWRYGYGADGRLETVTDPMSRVVGYTYDGGGRLASQIYPDGREVVYRYDNNGNMVAVVPPGRPAHEFRVDSRGVRSEYIAPDVGISSGGTRFSYNLDGQLTTIERPGGTSVDFLYDTFGRPLQVMTPDGTMDYDYDPTAGRLAAITAPSGEQLNFTFDAVLPTIVESAGEVSGTVEFTYDDDFTITAVGVNGDPGPMVRRDLDGLLIGVGDLNIDRDPINGTMTGTALGRVTSTRTHNEFAEIVTQETAIDGVGLFRVEYLRDPVGGSITGIRETIDGATTETNYTYDITGRLTSVDVNGTVTTLTTLQAVSPRLM